MPTRVVTGGVGVIPGATMNEKRLHFMEHLDDLRLFLMNEPRGHAAMSGAILQPPTRDDCDWGVVYIEVSGCLPMCGHGTIGVATVLVETGMVEVIEPVTTIRLDTPAGLVIARVAVSDGHADSVTIENVPSYVDVLDASIEVPGLGTVPYSMAFGGNFYAMVELDAVGLPFDRARQQAIVQAGLAIMDADQHHGAPDASVDPGGRPLPPRRVHRPGLGREALPARDGDLPGLVRPLALRDGNLRAHGRAVGARRTGARHRLRQ